MHTTAWAYLGFTFAWSWFFWGLFILLQLDTNSTAGLVLFSVGGLGPAVAALVLTWITEDKLAPKDYGERLIDFRRISLRWWAVILLAPAFTGLLAMITGFILDKPENLWGPATEYLTFPTVVFFLLSTLIFGPLPEELGWRGYCLPKLQRSYSSLRASLIVGSLWAVWHLPLFLTLNSPFAGSYPLGSFPFWMWLAGLTAASVVMTWIHNHTRQSTLAAVGFHFALNATGGLLRLSTNVQVLQFGWWVVLAMVLVMTLGPQLQRPTE
jgi:membrane protease YdiL (CAAX protease family)